MSIDTRREQQHIWKEYGRFYKTIGEEVIWFKFDTDASQWDDVYDEGGRSYKPGIRVPALWVDQIEDPEQYSGEGRRPTQRLRFAVSASSLAMRGINTQEAHGNTIGALKPSAPYPAQTGRPAAAWLDDRLNDVVFYDNRFYSLSNFQIRGRLQTQDVVIGVAGIELILDDEVDFDFFPYDNRLMDAADFQTDAENLDIWSRDGGNTDVTIIFGIELEGTWTALASNENGNQEIPVTVSGTDIVLDLSGFTDGFPWTWELRQRTPANQFNLVYRGNIYEVLDVIDDDDNTEWLDIYIVDDELPSTTTIEFRDPETNALIDPLEGEWDAYIELPTGTWGIPLINDGEGTIELDFTEFEAQLPASWWLIQTAPTGEMLKTHEGSVYLVEQE